MAIYFYYITIDGSLCDPRIFVIQIVHSSQLPLARWERQGELSKAAQVFETNKWLRNVTWQNRRWSPSTWYETNPEDIERKKYEHRCIEDEKYDGFWRLGEVVATWTYIWESILGRPRIPGLILLPVRWGKTGNGMPVLIYQVKQLLMGYTFVNLCVFFLGVNISISALCASCISLNHHPEKWDDDTLILTYIPSGKLR